MLAFYGIGRWRGRWVRKRWPKARPLILRSVVIVRRHPWRASLISRFAYGVRIALPIACGIGRIPLSTYAIGTAVSSVLWAGVFTGAGWAMGDTVVDPAGVGPGVADPDTGDLDEALPAADDPLVVPACRCLARDDISRAHRAAGPRPRPGAGRGHLRAPRGAATRPG